ncbi:MAG: DUF1800 domain-containing protein [Bacteroidia bacterium]
MSQAQKKILHLYARAGFGIDYKSWQRFSENSIEKNIQQLFDDSANYSNLSVVDEDMTKKKIKDLKGEEKKEFKKQLREKVQELNTTWFLKMANDNAQLREKMTLFWHGHFACRIDNPLFLQDLNNILRANALGDFKKMLSEVSKSPAMLQFLNNQQNKKDHPNENFAREVMELFTIGRDNYSEQDIRESARAYTGWRFNKDGQFEFVERIHDDGSKTFMGKTGNFNGDDILGIILQQIQTAHFITKKIYAFLVNDDVDESRVTELSESFFNSGYDIGSLLKNIFSSNWFYERQNVGTKIKSPTELIVGTNKLFSVMYQDPKVLLYMQRLLGQVLFYPPNVSGWKGGKSWIDSSSLMFRIKLASIVLNSGIINMEVKNDMPEDFMMMMEQEHKIQQKVQKKVQTIVDWNSFLNTLPANISQKELIAFILMPDLSKNMEQLLDPFSKEKIKDITIQLLSTPQYQLC